MKGIQLMAESVMSPFQIQTYVVMNWFDCYIITYYQLCSLYCIFILMWKTIIMVSLRHVLPLILTSLLLYEVISFDIILLDIILPQIVTVHKKVNHLCELVSYKYLNDVYLLKTW